MERNIDKKIIVNIDRKYFRKAIKIIG